MAARVSPRALQIVEKVQALAQQRDLSGGQLALLWVKDQPGITAPITGPRTLAQLQEALDILDQKLDDSDRQAIDELNPPGSAASDFYNSSGWMKMQVG
jgi:aryl-alcohol dehydrogenase-like predicted oxidoreductase